MSRNGRFAVELDAPSPKAAQASQEDRFRRVAQELGCDEDEAAFKAKLGVIARQKPKDETAPAKGASNGKKRNLRG